MRWRDDYTAGPKDRVAYDGKYLDIESAVDPAPFEQAIAQIDTDAPFDERLTAATDLIQRRIVDIWKLVSRLGPRHHPHERRPLPQLLLLPRPRPPGAA